MRDSEKLDLILEKVNILDEKVNTLDEKVSDVEVNLQEVKQRVISTELVIENEIRVNLQRVAEGHLDLSRNLHEAMRPSNEVEVLSIKVRMLETDVKKLKEKLV